VSIQTAKNRHAIKTLLRWAGHAMLHRGHELPGQNGERPRGDQDITSMDRGHH
jgi:hypothetical protein